jgi:hypothetical protein
VYNVQRKIEAGAVDSALKEILLFCSGRKRSRFFTRAVDSKNEPNAEIEEDVAKLLLPVNALTYKYIKK